jgi:hypothetical protein
VPSAGRPPAGRHPWPHSMPERAVDAARASTDSAALGDRAHAPVPAHEIGREPSEPPASVPGRDDPAGVPATDVSLDHGPDREPQTATPVSDPIQVASAQQRPSGPSVTPPAESEDVQAESGPANPAASPPSGWDRVSPDMPSPSPGANAAGGHEERAAVEPRRPGPAADAGGRASSGATVDARPSRPAIDPPAPAPNVPTANGRPASPAAADPSGHRAEVAAGKQARSAEPRRSAETPLSPAVADPARRPPEGPPAQQRPAADPPRDPSKRPSPEPGPTGPTSDSRGPAANGDSPEQPRSASASQPPKAPRPIEHAPGGDQLAKGSDPTAPMVVAQPASPAPSAGAQPAQAVTRPTTNSRPSDG